MKTIIENSTTISKYIFSDDAAVEIFDDHIVTPSFIIGDMNASSATMYDAVTPPEDWVGCKYLFDGTDWSANPNYVTPEI